MKREEIVNLIHDIVDEKVRVHNLMNAFAIREDNRRKCPICGEEPFPSSHYFRKQHGRVFVII